MSPTTLFHGSPRGDIETFDLDRAKRQEYGSGVYFTENKDVARSYARAGGDGYVYRCTLASGSYIDASDLEELLVIVRAAARFAGLDFPKRFPPELQRAIKGIADGGIVIDDLPNIVRRRWDSVDAEELAAALDTEIREADGIFYVDPAKGRGLFAVIRRLEKIRIQEVEAA